MKTFRAMDHLINWEKRGNGGKDFLKIRIGDKVTVNAAFRLEEVPSK